MKIQELIESTTKLMVEIVEQRRRNAIEDRVPQSDTDTPLMHLALSLAELCELGKYGGKW